jgi:hypothetical protein
MSARGGGILKCRVHTFTPGTEFGVEGDLVAVPMKLLTGQLLVTHGVGEQMMIATNQPPVATRMVNGIFEQVKMAYFKWQPTVQAKLF